jgi:excisionase family DNA binding protein
MAVERLALSVAEAAAALGVSKDAIYDAVRCHELPAIRFGVASSSRSRRWSSS